MRFIIVEELGDAAQALRDLAPVVALIRIRRSHMFLLGTAKDDKDHYMIMLTPETYQRLRETMLVEAQYDNNRRSHKGRTGENSRRTVPYNRSSN